MTGKDNGPQPVPQSRRREEPIQRCPICGAPMLAIAGSRSALCGNCGYKESCC